MDKEQQQQQQKEFPFFESKADLPNALVDDKFMLSDSRLYAASVHFSLNSAEKFPDQEMAGFGVLVRSYFKGKDGILHKNKGFKRNDDDTPEVGIYLRWEEFNNLVRLHKLLKKECKKLKKQKKDQNKTRKSEEKERKEKKESKKSVKKV